MNSLSTLKKIIYVTLSIAGLLFAGSVTADGKNSYDITITNLTRGEIFTPILVASTAHDSKLFTLGAAASGELEIIAESGNPVPLSNTLIGTGAALDVVTSAGVLAPGKSVTLTVKTSSKYRYITVASMLVPTNDAFFAVNGVHTPKGHKTLTVYSPAYDAGTETNDELCDAIPGPPFICTGEGVSAASGEGYVHIHAGIQGVGDLIKANHDWRNPVVKITIRRTRR